MSKRKEGGPTELKGFRLRQSVVRRLESYAERHPLQPSEAKIVDLALSEWLDRNEPRLEALLAEEAGPPPDRPRRSPKPPK